MSRAVILTAVVLCAGLCVWGGCFVPPSASLQSARTVDKEKARLTPYWSGIRETGESENEKIADEFGILAGIGVGNQAELQLRYDRIQLTGEDEDGYNFTSLGPKFSTANQRIAFILPVGFYYGSGISAGDTFQIHPGMIGTIPFAQTVDLRAEQRGR